MSRTFNGTSDTMSRALDLSAYTKLTIAYWLNWTTNANDDKLACEFTVNHNTTAGSFVVDQNASGGAIQFDSGNGAGKYWADSIPRPSTGVWHHYVYTLDRATPVNTAYVDGVSQTLTTIIHDAVAFGNFANSTLYLMNRGGASLFGAGSMAHYALWGGVLLNSDEAKLLGSGVSPLRVRPASLICYIPMAGASSPEPDVFNPTGFTLSGTTAGTTNPPTVGQNIFSTGDGMSISGTVS